MNATYLSLRSSQIWKSFLFLALSVSTAHAYFEGFEDLTDHGGWRLTDNSLRVLQVEPSGGNPGAYLHGQVSTAVPTWYVPFDRSHTQFLGNYAAHHVIMLSFDLNIFSGTQVPNRNVTLDMITTFGTGDFRKGIEAYYIGADISKLPRGWQSYYFPIDSVSPTIPPGWVVFRGNGHAGNNADWRALMRNVETLGLELGTPGFAYPSLNIWDLGLDNVRLSRKERP